MSAMKVHTENWLDLVQICLIGPMWSFDSSLSLIIMVCTKTWSQDIERKKILCHVHTSAIISFTRCDGLKRCFFYPPLSTLHQQFFSSQVSVYDSSKLKTPWATTSQTPASTVSIIFCYLPHKVLRKVLHAQHQITCCRQRQEALHW